MPFQFLDGRFRAETDVGLPLVGGLLYTYSSGTTTPKATYADATLTAPNTNPVTLNARGEAQVWLGTGAYTLRLTDAAGVVLWDVGDVSAPDAAGVGAAAAEALRNDLASSAAGKGAALVALADAGGNWNATTLEALVAEIPTRIRKSVSDITKLQTAITAGGGLRLADGVHVTATTLTSNYSAPAFPAWGAASARFDLVGDSCGDTIIQFTGATNAHGLALTGEPTAVSQGVHAIDRVSDLTLIRTVNTMTGRGVYAYGKAYTRFERLVISGWEEGIRLNGVLSSYVGDCVLTGNKTGAVVDYTSTALLPNALDFSRVAFASNTVQGVVFNVCGATNRIQGGAVENNGVTGTVGGGMLVNVTGLNGTACLTIDSVYFEANGGLGDLVIDNVSGIDVTVTVTGCTFNRLLSGRYTVNNIRAQTSGGGRLRVIVSGCGFMSGGTYSPSATRYFMVSTGNAEIIDGGGNVYSETTSLGATGTNWPAAAGAVYAGRVADTGAIIAGAPDITVTHASTGLYTITKGPGFGSTVDSYVAHAVSNDTAGGRFVERVVQISPTTFQVVTRNTAGAAADINFSWTAARLA